MIPFPAYWPCIALAFWQELLKPKAAMVIEFDKHFRKALVDIEGLKKFKRRIKNQTKRNRKLTRGLK